MNKRYHPVLQLPRTPLETLLEVLIVLGIIAIVAMTVWGCLVLPASIPTHYNLAGTPDKYGSKDSLLILPVLAICLAVLLMVLSRYPHINNYPWPITAENAPRQYYLGRLLLCWITFELTWSQCGIQWILIRAAQSHATASILLVLLVMVLALIATIILYIRAAFHSR